MARDSRGRPQGFRPRRHALSRRAFRWPRRLRGRRVVAARAWEGSEPDPWRPSLRRDRPKTARRPRCGRVPRHICQSRAYGIHRANRARRRAGAPREPASLFAGGPQRRQWSDGASVVLRYSRDQAGGKILRHAVEGRFALLKEAFDVAANIRGRAAGSQLVFVSKDEIVAVVEHLVVVALGQSDYAAHGDHHGGGLSEGRARGRTGALEQEWNHLEAEHSTRQNGVSVLRVRHDPEVGLPQKLVDGRSRELLFDLVSRGLIFERRNRDDVDALGQTVAAPGDVVSASRQRESNRE